MPKTKILVVDDQPIIRTVCDVALTLHGFDPLLAEDGQRGLDVFTERYHEIGLVLVDVSMPKMGGLEMVRRMYELKPHPNVILMTGYCPQQIVPDHLQKVCALLPKPFTAQKLIQMINKCLNSDEKVKEPHDVLMSDDVRHDRRFNGLHVCQRCGIQSLWKGINEVPQMVSVRCEGDCYEFCGGNSRGYTMSLQQLSEYPLFRDAPLGVDTSDDTRRRSCCLGGSRGGIFSLYNRSRRDCRNLRCIRGSQ